MSAANSAASQVRRSAAPAPTAAPRPAMRSPQPQPQALSFTSADRGDEIRINLGDIHIGKESMEIDGFKPSLLSRFLDIVSPLK